MQEIRQIQQNQEVISDANTSNTSIEVCVSVVTRELEEEGKIADDSATSLRPYILG